MNRFPSRSLWLYLICVGLQYLVTVPSYGQGHTDSIEAIIEQMPLEHKVGQMFMVNLFGSQLTIAGRDILEVWQPGAVVLLKLNAAQPPDQVKRLVDSYQASIVSAGGIPLFVAVDQEGGLIQHLQDGFTVWPVPMVLTAANDPALAEAVGRSMGQEMRLVGVNMNLAPVADLYTNIRNPIIGRRSFGSDPVLVGETIQALVSGLQSAGVIATVKHFPGHGATSEDSHTTLPELSTSLTELETTELIPFEMASDSGAMMSSHIWFSQLEPEPIPASLSTKIVTGLLRDDMAYDGIIMTDALDMDAIDTQYSLAEASIKAIMAGNDMIIIGANVGEQMQDMTMRAVVEAVYAGRISEERINQSVRRILMAKAEYGVLDWQPGSFDSVEFGNQLDLSTQLVNQLFEEGTTVVQNNGLIPIDDNQRVGVVFPGTRYHLKAICDDDFEQIIWLARSGSPSESEIELVVNLANQVDVVVIFTQDAYYDETQSQLVNRLPSERTIVIALSSPFDLARFPEIGGYVATYSPLDAGVDVACQVIFGKIEAHGIFPVDLSIAIDSS